MSIDFAALHGLIAAEIAATNDMAASMQRVIDACARQAPHSDWDRLRALPYDGLDDLRDWLENVFAVDPPRAELAGLWFGLFNPVYQGQVVADLHLCGSRQFSSDPYDNSWAVQPDWRPQHRDAHSSILRDIYRIAYRPAGLGNNAEYPLSLAYGGLAVRTLLHSILPEIVLGSSRQVGVAVGFDSGDFVLLGTLTQRGLDALSNP